MTDEEKQKLSRRIALRIKEHREKAGMKQSALADKIGMSRPSLNRIETEARDVPSLVTLVRIAKGLGCVLTDLVGGTDAPDEVVPLAPVEAAALPTVDKPAG